MTAPETSTAASKRPLTTGRRPDMIAIREADRKPLTAGPGLEPHPRDYPQPDRRPGAGSTRTQPAGTSVYRLLRAHDLSPARPTSSSRRPESSRTRPRRPTSSGRPTSPISRSRAGAGAGTILSLHRARRLLALHRRLEALRDDESAGCDRHARPGVGGLRA
jgi:hypothetical protein